MALSDANIAKVYEIVGLPQQGSASVVEQLASLRGPTAETFDFDAVITMFDERIAAISSDQQDLVEDLIARWGVLRR